nr:immunoglobulin light chain junction region [Macaca mulatta]MOX24476.1 immunoglobulin light chain junction region [Macaca mulatta]MOX25354.1 immunoglobulin light chain junction region [Macaca mulatta]MOX25811.1 immunoglobulin light chain junction region [Macaca mulatta]MOX26256.1 immunoglobulin light chain junction region [Macaca mulatta]
CLQGFRAPFSF